MSSLINIGKNLWSEYNLAIDKYYSMGVANPWKKLVAKLELKSAKIKWKNFKLENKNLAKEITGSARLIESINSWILNNERGWKYE